MTLVWQVLGSREQNLMLLNCVNGLAFLSLKCAKMIAIIFYFYYPKHIIICNPIKRIQVLSSKHIFYRYGFNFTTIGSYLNLNHEIITIIANLIIIRIVVQKMVLSSYPCNDLNRKDLQIDLHNIFSFV